MTYPPPECDGAYPPPESCIPTTVLPTPSPRERELPETGAEGLLLVVLVSVVLLVLGAALVGWFRE